MWNHRSRFNFIKPSKFFISSRKDTISNWPFSFVTARVHSALIRNLIKVKGTGKLTVQGERVCLKDSKYILFEILANRTWKGRTSSCLPSQPNCQIGLARPAEDCMALPCPICYDFKQNIFAILEVYSFTLCI